MGKIVTRLAKTCGETGLEDFFENGAIALHIVDGDGKILRANKAELELLGYPAEEYIGRHVAEFHADLPVIEDILERLLSGETIRRYPARLRASDGYQVRRDHLQWPVRRWQLRQYPLFFR